MADEIKSTETVLAWHQRCVELDHPNPYFAFIKSAAWATFAFMFVCVFALLSTLSVNYLILTFFPNANKLFVFIVDCFGYTATIVSFLMLIIVMIVESRVLIIRLWREGHKASGGHEDE